MTRQVAETTKVKKKVSFADAMKLVNDGLMTQEAFDNGITNGTIASNNRQSSLPSFVEKTKDGDITLSPRLYITGGSKLGNDTPFITRVRSEVYKVVSKLVEEHNSQLTTVK